MEGVEDKIGDDSSLVFAEHKISELRIYFVDGSILKSFYIFYNLHFVWVHLCSV